MSVISYMLIVIAAYILCTMVAVILSKSTTTEYRNVTIVNVIFMILVALMFFIVNQIDQLATTFFKFITL